MKALTIINNTELDYSEIFGYLGILLEDDKPKTRVFHTYHDFKLSISVGHYPKGIRCVVEKA